MSFNFNSRINKKEYTIQITTDNYEQFLFIQEMARQCVDGKHKEKHGDTETFAEHYDCLPDTIFNKNNDAEDQAQKKYRYNVGLFAEETQTGTVDLTERDASIVAYATEPNNWNSCDGGGFCGSFWIDKDNPIEIED